MTYSESYLKSITLKESQLKNWKSTHQSNSTPGFKIKPKSMNLALLKSKIIRFTPQSLFQC